MDVAVDAVPPCSLVVEVVDGNAAIRRGAELAGEVGDPVAGEGRAHRNACVCCTVACDVALVGVLAVTASAALVNRELIRIERFGKTAGGAVFGDPAEDVDAGDDFRADGGVGNHLRVELRGVLLTGGAGLIFKIPVGGGAGDVEQVIVAGGSVAAEAIDGDIGSLPDRGGEIEGVHAVDVGADGVGLVRGVNGERGSGGGRGRRERYDDGSALRGVLHAGGGDGDRDRRGVGRRVETGWGKRGRAERTAGLRRERPGYGAAVAAGAGDVGGELLGRSDRYGRGWSDGDRLDGRLAIVRRDGSAGVEDDGA